MSEPLCDAQWSVQPSGSYDPDLLRFGFGFGIGTASALSAYIVLIYDYFLTLPGEINGFWCAGSHTWASVVFLVNRYVAVLGHLPLFYTIFCGSCNTRYIVLLGVSYQGILVLVTTFLTAVLLVMRVYALYCRNKWVLVVVMFEIIAGTLLACWSLTRLSLPGPGGSDTKTPGSDYRIPVALAYSGLLVVDFTVFVLTIARSIRLWTRSEPFLHRVFIDGLLYYGVIWNLNLVNIILLLVKPSINLSLPVFTNILLVVMVSRLMINLRDPTLGRPGDFDMALTTSHGGSISTFVLEDTLPTSAGSVPESNP